LATSYVDNRNLPPYELSILGGKDFRGYPDNRFIDRGVLKLNIEERIRVARLEVMRVPFDLEAAPFLEFGQVFDSPSEVALQETRVSYGMGLRAVVRPNVVGKVDVGAADEGLNIFVGLDYPF
jgi:hemolysin activation/secretion protein